MDLAGPAGRHLAGNHRIRAPITAFSTIHTKYGLTAMSRAESTGVQPAGEGATVTWVLADNTPVAVTAAELSEALNLAGAEQARLWVASHE